jgi:PqqD family protein of HPr-rel-A system
VVYHVDPPDTLRIVPLDSLTAIFHRRSGQTHVVAEPIPEILGALRDGPADIATLAARLDLTADDEAALTARLDELIQSGLVFRA